MWDNGKACFQRKIRAFCRQKASLSRRRISSLEHTLFFLRYRADRGEEVSTLINDTRAELEDLHRQRSRGARIRSNVQWAEEGELSTGYFFRLEKRKGECRLFSAIRTLSGVIVSSLADISRASVSFYGSLFTAKLLDISQQDFFLDKISRRLTAAQRALCEGELTLAECQAALAGMSTGKSHGLDGFPAEFYRYLWPLIGQDYVDVVNYCYFIGRLSTSQRSVVITLLYKRGDRLNMKNWRPITLLFVDYKIAAKLIANRLLLVLQFLLHTDQSTLGLSLFWYLAPFICIPDQVIRNINGRDFSFVWKRKQEWLARSSVSQHSSRGGLGIVDAPRKVASLHVLWVRRLVDSPDLPWFYFFRYFLRRAFPGRPLQQILLILSPSSTSMDLLPPFYRSVMHSWFRLSCTFDAGEIVLRGHGTSSCPLKSLSARLAYQAFSHMDRTEHRCVEKFRSWGLTVHWKTVWLNLDLWRFLHPARDTAWLVAHGILPTADRLIRFGMSINPLCHCGRTESLIHLFVD